MYVRAPQKVNKQSQNRPRLKDEGSVQMSEGRWKEGWGGGCAQTAVQQVCGAMGSKPVPALNSSSAPALRDPEPDRRKGEGMVKGLGEESR